MAKRASDAKAKTPAAENAAEVAAKEPKLLCGKCRALTPMNQMTERNDLWYCPSCLA